MQTQLYSKSISSLWPAKQREKLEPERETKRARARAKTPQRRRRSREVPRNGGPLRARMDHMRRAQPRRASQFRFRAEEPLPFV